MFSSTYDANGNGGFGGGVRISSVEEDIPWGPAPGVEERISRSRGVNGISGREFTEMLALRQQNRNAY